MATYQKPHYSPGFSPAHRTSVTNDYLARADAREEEARAAEARGDHAAAAQARKWAAECRRVADERFSPRLSAGEQAGVDLAAGSGA